MASLRRELLISCIAFLIISLIVFIFLVFAIRIIHSEPTVILGSGSGFSDTVYSRWAQLFNTNGQLVSYTATSSDSGLYQLLNSTSTSFAGITPLHPSFHSLTLTLGFDTPMNSTNLSRIRALQMPSVATGVVLVYNLPFGSLPRNQQLNLTFELIVGIYNGTFTHWNDSKLLAEVYSLILPVCLVF